MPGWHERQSWLPMNTAAADRRIIIALFGGRRRSGTGFDCSTGAGRIAILFWLFIFNGLRVKSVGSFVVLAVLATGGFGGAGGGEIGVQEAEAAFEALDAGVEAVDGGVDLGFGGEEGHGCVEVFAGAVVEGRASGVEAGDFPVGGRDVADDVEFDGATGAVEGEDGLEEIEVRVVILVAADGGVGVGQGVEGLRVWAWGGGG